MKHLLPLFILFSTITFGQTYVPFKDTIHKRFENIDSPNDNDHYFYSRLTETSSDTITFNQYRRVSSYTVNVANTACEMWGGGMQPTADTSWLGRKIHYLPNTQNLILFNDSTEELNFNFGIALGDSAIFYTNGSEEYYIRYDGISQELVIDSLENVKYFSVHKYDNLNNPLSSSLNGFDIKISENLGLVNFIGCKEFPQAEMKYTLMGQVHPTIGKYQLTYDEAYPWHPGDTIQTRGRTTHDMGGTLGVSYRLVTIDNRVETSDSVWIYLNIETEVVLYNPMYNGGIYNIYFPQIIKFKKGDQIMDLPNKAQELGFGYIYDTTSDCGIRERIRFQNNMTEYCESCDCFTPYDGDGSAWESKRYLEGLGVRTSSISSYGGQWSEYATQIYSNINGEICGQLITLSLDEQSLNEKEKTLVKVIDILGRETKVEPNRVMIYIYSDGTSKKVFKTAE